MSAGETEHRGAAVQDQAQQPHVSGGLGCGGVNSDAAATGDPEGLQRTRTRSSSGQAQTPLWTLKAISFLGTAAWACVAKFIVVFYADIGVSRPQMGMLSLVGSIVAFFGQFFWASIIDRIGGYKVVLVSTTVIAASFLLSQTIPAIQNSMPLLIVVTAGGSFFGCCGGPIIDAMTLTVLEEQDEQTEGYGDQRLWVAVGWGGMSLLSGQLVDLFGINCIFYAYGGLTFLNLIVCSYFLPGDKRRRSATETVSLSSFIDFDFCWFLANAFMYGTAMTLVENYLMVFLVQDFYNTPKVLVGASVAVMCAFEVPVFKYIDRLWKPRTVAPTDGDSSNVEVQQVRPPRCSLTGVMFFCQVLLVVRCLLYTVLPPTQPWLVLFIEPLHGITFAAMWTATVEYGNRLAPKEARARMMTLLNGFWFQAAGGFGSIFWGWVIQEPPKGLGFRRSFVLNAAFVVVWCVIWQAGLIARGRARSAREVQGGSADLLERLERE